MRISGLRFGSPTSNHSLSSTDANVLQLILRLCLPLFFDATLLSLRCLFLPSRCLVCLADSSLPLLSPLLPPLRRLSGLVGRGFLLLRPLFSRALGGGGGGGGGGGFVFFRLFLLHFPCSLGRGRLLPVLFLLFLPRLVSRRVCLRVVLLLPLSPRPLGCCGRRRLLPLLPVFPRFLRGRRALPALLALPCGVGSGGAFLFRSAVWKGRLFIALGAQRSSLPSLRRRR